MKFIILSCVALLLSTSHVSAYVYGRCEFAETLRWDYGFSREYLGDWVCLVQWESSYNTRATNKTTSGSYDSEYFGIYQIDDYNSCYSPSHPNSNDCYINCEDLINDNIDDDVACSVIIYNRHGFSAWHGWQLHCNGYDVESYVSDCFV